MAYECGFLDGAESNIISHTLESVLNSVRFYYKECTPTLHSNEGIKQCANGTAHMPIPVLLLFDKQIMLHDDIMISDGGCGSSRTVITNDIVVAYEFDWQEVFRRGAYNIPIDVENKGDLMKQITNTRNAEFLYPNEISIDYIKKIIFRSNADLKHAIFLYGKNSLFEVNQRKFNNKNGKYTDRAFLKDYIVERKGDRFHVELMFENDINEYTHNIMLCYKNGHTKEISVSKYIKDNENIRFTINNNSGVINEVKYLLNGYISAIWR
jgi:hypothetical protein